MTLEDIQIRISEIENEFIKMIEVQNQARLELSQAQEHVKELQTIINENLIESTPLYKELQDLKIAQRIIES